MTTRGRPTKLTPEMQQQIVALLRNGNYVETVCDYVGISKETFYDWLRRGEVGGQRNTIYVEFSDAAKKAISAAETIALSEIRTGVDNWQSRAWFLERRHRDRWGNKQAVEHTTPKGDPFTIEVRHVSYRQGLTADDPTDSEA